jgi:hypothetical protein
MLTQTSAAAQRGVELAIAIHYATRLEDSPPEPTGYLPSSAIGQGAVTQRRGEEFASTVVQLD